MKKIVTLATAVKAMRRKRRRRERLPSVTTGTLIAMVTTTNDGII